MTQQQKAHTVTLTAPSTLTVLSNNHTAEEIILTYMTQQNIPFAATDVHLNLKGAVTKPAAQKALVALADQGKLLKKEYGGFIEEAIRQHTLAKTVLLVLLTQARLLSMLSCR